MTAVEYDPKADAEFFADITAVFRKYPEAAEKYALASLALERQLKIDFTRQSGVSRIDGGRIVTEFHDRESEPTLIRRGRLCLKYELRGQDLECVHWIEAPQ